MRHRCTCYRLGLVTPPRKDHCCTEPHSEGQALCEQCRLPLCSECFEHLKEAKLPPLSYANDMWTGYGLERIYRQKVTVIELACASPCLTSLVLMSLESKHRKEAGNAIFDEEAHMARHRYGARGNVITFPLPMEALLQQLVEHVNLDEAAAGEVMPRSGRQLSEIFRVILKTNKKGKTTEQEIKTLIHQARVRRQAWMGVGWAIHANKKNMLKLIQIRMNEPKHTT